jgi:hypothetical protein
LFITLFTPAGVNSAEGLSMLYLHSQSIVSESSGAVNRFLRFSFDPPGETENEGRKGLFPFRFRLPLRGSWRGAPEGVLFIEVLSAELLVAAPPPSSPLSVIHNTVSLEFFTE